MEMPFTEFTTLQDRIYDEIKESRAIDEISGSLDRVTGNRTKKLGIRRKKSHDN